MMSIGFLRGMGHVGGCLLRRVLDIVREATAGSDMSIIPSERISLDRERFSEYRDSNEHPAKGVFEQDYEPGRRLWADRLPGTVEPILTYFLDGSRRTYKVADVIVGGQYLPVVAGQVGVSIVERDKHTRRLSPLRKYCSFHNVLAFPDKIAAADCADLEGRIHRESRTPLHVVRYALKEGGDPVDLGIAKIMSEMADGEIETVLRMADDNTLSNTRVLVIDGPLRFKKTFDVVHFRNVIGLSKSFRPSFAQGKGRGKTSVGQIASSLVMAQRSPVFETEEGANKIGMWYLRIRPELRLANPIQGVVKMECFAVDPVEREQGFDSSRIDTLSSHLLRERNVTPYGADDRWASHIYPIYVAETYAKRTFMSDVAFKSIF